VLWVKAPKRRVHHHRASTPCIPIERCDQRQGHDLLLPGRSAHNDLPLRVDDFKAIAVIDLQSIERRLIAQPSEHLSGTRFHRPAQFIAESAFRRLESAPKTIGQVKCTAQLALPSGPGACPSDFLLGSTQLLLDFSFLSLGTFNCAAKASQFLLRLIPLFLCAGDLAFWKVLQGIAKAAALLFQSQILAV